MDWYFDDRVLWAYIKRVMRREIIPPSYYEQQLEKLLSLKQWYQSVK